MLQARREFLWRAFYFAAPLCRTRGEASADELEEKAPWTAPPGSRGEATQGGTGRSDRSSRVLPREPVNTIRCTCAHVTAADGGLHFFRDFRTPRVCSP